MEPAVSSRMAVAEVHEAAVAMAEEADLVRRVAAGPLEPLLHEDHLAGALVAGGGGPGAVLAEAGEHLAQEFGREALIGVEVEVPGVLAGDVVDGPVASRGRRRT